MIDPDIIAILTAVAVLTGFIDSIAGGGGLIMMPALLTAGLPPVNALATNKLQSMFGTALATFNYHRKGLVDWRGLAPTLALLFAGACLGVWLVQQIAPGALGLVVSALLLAVALYVLLSPRMSDEDAHERLSPRGYAPVGGLIGLYDGFFGPGAGSFYTTSLVALRGMGLTRATATTKALNVTSNIASVAMFAVGGKMLWALGLPMAAGAMAGNWIGSHVAMKHGARVIRPLLVVMSLGLTARLVWSYLAG